ncbi:TetR/AcrR family transcriptional regulator [Nocardiopsis baichengensis]|uniref:TetR/AcrR family transcriptional regulator n=1 Tax=Nocardiopsis baichengensis TaxID=280240 RepID=UPI00034C2403|nr:TetR/AcrR family transcriptional regulator [Nocardiopsis baichengensis]
MDEEPQAEHAAGEGARPKGTRRRGEELVRAIHDAAVEEAAQRGFDGATMEGIARRAGTAKTSLYRRWDTPEDIILEALRATYPVEEPAPGADDLRGDLVAALRLMRDSFLGRPLYAQAMSTTLEASWRRPDLHKRLYREVFDPRGGRFTKTALLHYADRGIIPRERVTPVVVDLGEALLFKYMIDSMRPPSDEYLEQIVDQAILPAVGIAPGTP